MATFTTNAERNFSSTKKAPGIFDRAFTFSLFLVILVGGIWATERVLIYITDRQIANYQASTAASLESVNPDEVQAVHDVTSRLNALAAKGEGANQAHTSLASLEKATVPQVTLTEYEYTKDGLAFIKGIAVDYRVLAEQILRYRQEPMFANAEVVTTGRTDNGQVNFEIRAEPAAPSS